eukprot:m.132222 g.132222  ORF g.132222 m.132222 type:complete len:75 (+) comp14806_c0_seq1:267-491(+)
MVVLGALIVCVVSLPSFSPSPSALADCCAFSGWLLCLLLLLLFYLFSISEISFLFPLFSYCIHFHKFSPSLFLL